MPSLKRYKSDPEYRDAYVARCKEYYKNHREEILKKKSAKTLKNKKRCDVCKKLYKISDEERHNMTYLHKYLELKQKIKNIV